MTAGTKAIIQPNYYYYSVSVLSVAGRDPPVADYALLATRTKAPKAMAAVT